MKSITVSSYCALVTVALAAEWSYDNSGQDWLGTCDVGIKQSPVSLFTNDTVRFTFSVDVRESDIPDSGVIVNNGHTLVYTPNTDGAVTVRNPMLSDAEYRLAQFHCHWDDTGVGSTPRGSEHILNGHAYPLECHFVHYKEVYGSLGDAVTHSDGLMVIGQFYELAEDCVNGELDKVIEASVNVIEKGTNFTMTETLKIKSLMTSNPDVLTYSGSLTTPGCNEIVSWYVLTTPLGIHLRQLQHLFALKKDANNTMGLNWRPVQPLNGRTVHRNFALSDEYGGGYQTGTHAAAHTSTPTSDMITLLVVAAVAIVAPALLLW